MATNSRPTTAIFSSELGKKKGTLGIIFRKAQNKIQDPAKLRRLIADLIDKEQWMSLDVDVKGDAYEGLLEKNAADVKGGAGQYFTPRALISAIVDVMQPAPGQNIFDPACGTGGFLLACYSYLSDPKSIQPGQRSEKALEVRGAERHGDRRRHGTVGGNEPVPTWHRRRRVPDRGRG